MKPPLAEDCSLLFYHQDQVTKLPVDATHLAGDEFCEFQMYSIEDHIFSIQGHPEFTRTYAKFRTDNLADKIDKTIYNEANSSLKNKTDELTVGKWIQHFLAGHF